MNREDAARKVRALREVTVERGATAGEAATAKRLADKLLATYRLDRVDSPPKAARVDAQARAPQATASDLDALRQAFARMGRDAVMADEVLRGFMFDPTTGEVGPNGKVKSYRNRANWKIEFDP